MIQLAGNNLVLNAIGGPADGNYIVLAGTHLAQRVAYGTPIIASLFDANGQFRSTNNSVATKPRPFFRFKLP